MRMGYAVVAPDIKLKLLDYLERVLHLGQFDAIFSCKIFTNLINFFNV